MGRDWSVYTPDDEARVRADRAAAGLPPTIEDPEVLTRAARVVIRAERTARGERRQRRRRKAGKGAT